MATIDDLLTTAAREGASDVYLKAGSFPVVRTNGEMLPAKGWPRLSHEDTWKIAGAIMSDRQKEKFKNDSEVDLSYSIPGIGRFRCSVYRQRGTVGLVFRVICIDIKSFSELGLPPELTNIANERRGLVLVTGSTGSGKSTALAAMVEHINNTRSTHIVTIEDPIEFSFKDKKAFIVQREIESDATSYRSALHGALRQNPDVILVSELRDLETTETVLMAAASGTLVLSSMQTLDATETIQRIISMYPSQQQAGVRMQLATSLRAIVSMRLIRRAGGVGRVPAAEVMKMTNLIRECIVQPERTATIRELIAKGRAELGMQTFDQSLLDLYTRKIISLDDALLVATVPDDFKLAVKGLQVATPGQLLHQSSQSATVI